MTSESCWWSNSGALWMIIRTWNWALSLWDSLRNLHQQTETTQSDQSQLCGTSAASSDDLIHFPNKIPRKEQLSQENTKLPERCHENQSQSEDTCVKLLQLRHVTCSCLMVGRVWHLKRSQWRTAVTELMPGQCYRIICQSWSCDGCLYPPVHRKQELLTANSV